MKPSDVLDRDLNLCDTCNESFVDCKPNEVLFGCDCMIDSVQDNVCLCSNRPGVNEKNIQIL